MLEQFDKELENFDTLLQPAPESKPRTPFDSPDQAVASSKFADMTPRQALSVLPVMRPLIWNMRKSSKLYDGTFEPTQDTADPAFITQLEITAHDEGAKDIKYVKVPPNAIFQHKGIPYQNAIVITVEMDKEELANIPLMLFLTNRCPAVTGACSALIMTAAATISTKTMAAHCVSSTARSVTVIMIS